MTKQELIKLLDSYPDDTRIIIRGYEGGYCDIDSLEERDINLDVHTDKWWYGPHDDYEDYRDNLVETALLIL